MTQSSFTEADKNLGGIIAADDISTASTEPGELPEMDAQTKKKGLFFGFVCLLPDWVIVLCVTFFSYAVMFVISVHLCNDPGLEFVCLCIVLPSLVNAVMVVIYFHLGNNHSKTLRESAPIGGVCWWILLSLVSLLFPALVQDA